MIKNLPISEARLQRTQRDSVKDDYLLKLKTVIQMGGLEYKSDLLNIVYPILTCVTRCLCKMALSPRASELLSHERLEASS